MEAGGESVLVGSNTSNLNGQEIGRAMQRSGKRGANSEPFHLLYCACGEKMRRMIYKKVCYRDAVPSPERGHSRAGRERYTARYAVWKCPGAGGKNGLVRSGCNALTLCEASMEQSFMEMLYQLRADYLLRGEQSDIVQGFTRLFESIPAGRRNGGFFRQQLHLMDLELEEMGQERREISAEAQHCMALMERYPGQSMEYNRYASMCAQYRLRITSLTEAMDKRAAEKEALRQSFDRIDSMRQNYEAFLEELRGLPDGGLAGRNAAGEDAAARLGREKLRFDERIFRSFVVSMRAEGDTVYYGMSFGMMISSTGNSRPFRAPEGEE